ncbi:MAG: PAS domain S-box protein, partial [Desulfuromonadales bacterium]|nr:PAS domain S-box protein [Desulfuromonadales bacterium]
MTFKLDRTVFDLVIVSDNDAFNFALKHRDDLFVDKPIVFCGVNGFEASQIEGITDVTGVAETPDLSATIQLIQKLHPKASELVVIGTTNDPTGRRNYEHLRRIEPSFQKLHFAYFNDLVMEDLLLRLKELKPGQVVFTSPTIKNKEGLFYDFATATELLSKASSVPLYGGWDFFLGHGIVGGKLISGAAQGTEVAQMALAILNGTDPAMIPVVSDVGSQYMFDYNELEKYQIPLDSLPQKRIIINQPVSFYSVNKGLFWAGLVFTFVFVLLSTVLALQILLRRKSERNLVASEARFRNLSDLTIEGIVIHDKGVAIDVNESVLNMFGYTREELLGANLIELLIAPEYHPTIKENIVKPTAKPYEVIARKKDGTLIPIEIESRDIIREN